MAAQSKLVRFQIATQHLAGRRTTGTIGPETDEQVLQKQGYRDEREYWQDALSEPMAASSFTHFLSLHQIDPSEPAAEFDKRSEVNRLLQAALRLALQASEPWLKRNPLSSLPSDKLGAWMVEPEHALRWLLKMPRRRELVPRGLVAYVEGLSLPCPAAKTRLTKSPTADQTATIKADAMELLKTDRRDDVVRRLVQTHGVDRDTVRSLMPSVRRRGEKLSKAKSAE